MLPKPLKALLLCEDAIKMCCESDLEMVLTICHLEVRWCPLCMIVVPVVNAVVYWLLASASGVW